MRFSKWQGLGNDYILVEQRDIPAAHADAQGGFDDDVVRAMCDRHFGVGGDGILVLGPSDIADARMLIHNPDASRAEMCGNGIRMAARYLVARGLVDGPKLAVETAGGVVRPRVQNGNSVAGAADVWVDMGIASTEGLDEVVLDGGARFAGRVVSVGNPHFVIRQDPTELDLPSLGPRLEHHPRFPDRTNVEFYAVVSPQRVVLRVWERGAGETLACGTGACATGFAAVLDAGCTSPVTVVLPGGELQVEVDGDQRVFMTGPAELVYEGDIDLDALVRAAPRAGRGTTPAL